MIKLTKEIFIYGFAARRACLSYARDSRGRDEHVAAGKLCVGILEEDNPLKSYFRFKPLLVYQPEGYAPFDGEKIYPGRRLSAHRAR